MYHSGGAVPEAFVHTKLGEMFNGACVLARCVVLQG